MYNFNTYQAEIDFRRDRIQRGTVKRHHRVPFVRRPAESRRSAN